MTAACVCEYAEPCPVHWEAELRADPYLRDAVAQGLIDGPER